MDAWVKFLEWTERKWDSRFAPILLPLAVLLATFPALSKTDLPLWAVTLASICCGITLILLWWISHLPPKISKGRIGFVVAVTAEGERERTRVSADFVAALQQLLAEVRNIAEIQVIELPKYHAQQVTNVDIAQNYLKRCHAHFVLFGTASIRKIVGVEHFVLRLQGIVVHKNISMATSWQFSQEMRAVLPLKVKVSCEDDMAGFELASQGFADSTKFVLATAALLSGDVKLAQRLLENLRANIKAIKARRKAPGTKALLEKLPARLIDVYLTQCLFHHFLWRSTRSAALLDEAKRYSLLLRKYAPDTEHSYLTLAIWHFVSERNIPAALAELSQCERRRIQSPVWRFSMAFLYAYSNDLDKALVYYRTAFRLLGATELPFELEEFMDWVLKEEPAKYQIHYCLGLVNLYAKEDLSIAKSEFDQFIARAQLNPQYAAAVSHARSCLAEIEARNANVDIADTEPFKVAS